MYRGSWQSRKGKEPLKNAALQGTPGQCVTCNNAAAWFGSCRTICYLSIFSSSYIKEAYRMRLAAFHTLPSVCCNYHTENGEQKHQRVKIME